MAKSVRIMFLVGAAALRVSENAISEKGLNSLPL
jgi:hypothetical protein